jgi:hypothetical protein
MTRQCGEGAARDSCDARAYGGQGEECSSPRLDPDRSGPRGPLTPCGEACEMLPRRIGKCPARVCPKLTRQMRCGPS